MTSLTIHRATKSWLIFIAKVSNEKWITSVRKNMTNFILKRRKKIFYDYIFFINSVFLPAKMWDYLIKMFVLKTKCSPLNAFSYRACPQWEENLGFTSDFHLNADTLISYHDEQSAPLPEIAKVERGGERERETRWHSTLFYYTWSLHSWVAG